MDKEGHHNVNVYLRIKPSESEYTYIDSIAQSQKQISINRDYDSRSFQFTHIFLPHDDQFKIFVKSCTKILDSVINGYNGCFIAYGQTGSGKTFSVIGEPERKISGILQYSLAYLLSNKFNFAVEISALQIYMEKAIDILTDNKNKQLNFTYTNQQGAVLKNATNLAVANENNIKQIISLIIKNRKTSKTRKNDQSSRSHAIFTIKVINKQNNCSNIFNIVDLAGSERIKKSSACGPKTTEETISINKSLTTLLKCIQFLASNNYKKSFKKSLQMTSPNFNNITLSQTDNHYLDQLSNSNISDSKEKKSSLSHLDISQQQQQSQLNMTLYQNGNFFVPFRESKLTMLLQKSLQGNSLLSLMITISPDIEDADESFSAMRFAISALKLEIYPISSPMMPVRRNSEQLPKQDKQINNSPIIREQNAQQEKQQIDYFTFTQDTSQQSNFYQQNNTKEENNQLQQESLLKQIQLLEQEKTDLQQKLNNSQFENTQLLYQLKQKQLNFLSDDQQLEQIINKFKHYLLNEKSIYAQIFNQNFFHIKKEFMLLSQKQKQYNNMCNSFKQFLQMLPDQVLIAILRKHYSAKKIQHQFKKYKHDKQKQKILSQEQIKLAMGKKMVTQLLNQMSHIFKQLSLNHN